jgi:hypothetical protein
VRGSKRLNKILIIAGKQAGIVDLKRLMMSFHGTYFVNLRRLLAMAENLRLIDVKRADNQPTAIRLTEQGNSWVNLALKSIPRFKRSYQSSTDTVLQNW